MTPKQFFDFNNGMDYSGYDVDLEMAKKPRNMETFHEMEIHEKKIKNKLDIIIGLN